MANETTNKTQEGEKHGPLYKAAQIWLGAASVVAIVLSFIPAANVVGAILQGGITLVETGMQLATGNMKKAAIAFGIGSLLTAASVVPFLGAIGNFAKGGRIAVMAVEDAEKVGVLARVGSTLRGAGRTVAKTSGEVFEKIPGSTVMKEMAAKAGKGATYVHGEYIAPITKGIRTSGGNVAKGVKSFEDKAVKWGAANEHIAEAGRIVAKAPSGLVRTGVIGLNVAGGALSLADGDTPPASVKGAWANRIEKERQLNARSSQANEH